MSQQYGVDRFGNPILVSPELAAKQKRLDKAQVRLVSAKVYDQIVNGERKAKPLVPLVDVKPVEKKPAPVDDDAPRVADDDLDEGGETAGAGIDEALQAQLDSIDQETDKARLEAIGRTHGVEIDKRRGLDAIREQVKAAIIASANGEGGDGTGDVD